jgi:hypothetical protein
MGINTPKHNRILETAADQHVIDGLNDPTSAITTLMIASVPVATKDIVSTFQSRIDARKAVETARTAWQTTVQADRDVTAKTKDFVSTVKASLLTAFAGNADALMKFGLTGRQKPAKKLDIKVVAVAKAKATRVARHTMGSKQKAAIKGTVDTTAPAIPVPAPAPSPAPVVVTPPATVAPTTQPATPVAAPVAAAPSPAMPATPHVS